MFSILQKSHDSVNAEDLETLQNEIERCLVKVVTQKWELERELIALNSISPDISSANLQATLSSSAATSTQSGKLRHKNLVQDPSENSSDGSKSTILGTNNGSGFGSISCTNSADDSVSSEGSLVSSLTGSTIITSSITEIGSHTQTNNSSSSSGVKRSNKSSNDRPSKRFRQNSNNSFPSTGIHTKRPPHSKHRSKILPSKFRNSIEESRPNKKQVTRNEAPDKLWPFVEQFCAAPTQKQIMELEEMIKSMDNDKEYFKVPALGKRELSSKDSPSKSDSSSNKNQRKSKTNKPVDEEAGLGALTQRLVSSLIEDAEYNGTDISKSNDSSQSKKKNPKGKTGKGIDINNAKNLERRIRQELEEYEILDQQDEIPYTSEEDEVLRELLASQHELLSIQNQNRDSMQRLLKRAKKHIELESERANLQEANSDVIGVYHRLIQAKQRKRNPTKKEKDVAWKALKVQEAIFKKCDDLYLSSLVRNGG